VHGIVDSDVVPAPDTAVVVEHRLRLERALAVLATFSDADRAAVMDDDAPAVRREAVRLAVRRHRARARLRAAIAGIAAILGRAVRPRRVAVAATPVALVGALVLTLAPHVTPAAPDAAPDRSVPVVRMPVTTAATVVAVRPVPRPAATPAAVSAGRVARDAVTRPAKSPREDIAKVPVAPHTGATIFQRDSHPGDPLVCVTSIVVVCPEEI
jgi:membrane-associated protease RseP (regulator of RpoE activity)